MEREKTKGKGATVQRLLRHKVEDPQFIRPSLCIFHIAIGTITLALQPPLWYIYTMESTSTIKRIHLNLEFY